MGKVVLIAITALVLVLGISGVALAAATPQQIYDDWAADGDLDGKYTANELQGFLDNASTVQYGAVDKRAELTAYVMTRFDTFPMTGAQIALIGIGALALVGVGLGLRKVARSRA